VTRSEANVVFEVDGEPALEFYRDYLGDLAAPSNDFLLAIFDAEHENSAAAIRAPLFADEAKGTITFAGDVPIGSLLRFAESGGRDRVVAAVTDSLDEALSRAKRETEAVLFFSCSGRKELLGTRVVEECDLLKARLPDVPFVGLYGYGELGPVGSSRASSLHNHTFICLLLSEPS